MANYTVINVKEIWTNKNFFYFSSFSKKQFNNSIIRDR